MEPVRTDSPTAEQLLTPVLVLDGADRVAWLNGACAAWLGSSRRRLVGTDAGVLEARPVALAELAARTRNAGQPLTARRQQFLHAGAERFADLRLAARDDGSVTVECHPIDEFPGEDPATLLPSALAASLRGLAHEIRNPLAGLQGAAQLLARRLVDAELRRYVEVIEAEGARLLALVERLLDPGLPAHEEAVNVHALLERVRVLAEAEAGWAVRLERDYDPSLPPLLGDPARLTQALLNLVRNALQAQAAEVRLRTRAEHNLTIGERSHRLVLRVEIEDNGCGIPDALRERVFLPLVSGRAEGTGLGLPLAQQVAREHGGSLAFRSRPGHTVFTLLLPVPVALPAGSDAPGPIQAATSASSAAGGAHVQGAAGRG